MTLEGRDDWLPLYMLTAVSQTAGLVSTSDGGTRIE